MYLILDFSILNNESSKPIEYYTLSEVLSKSNIQNLVPGQGVWIIRATALPWQCLRCSAVVPSAH